MRYGWFGSCANGYWKDVSIVGRMKDVDVGTWLSDDVMALLDKQKQDKNDNNSNSNSNKCFSFSTVVVVGTV